MGASSWGTAGTGMKLSTRSMTWIVVRFGEGDEAAAPGRHLFQVALDFLQDRTPGGQDHHRHVLVDKGDGTVLHFAGGVALGVDVGDFLEFQGPFQGYGVVKAPPEVQEVLGVHIGLGDFPDLHVQVQGLLHPGGQVYQLPQALADLRPGELPPDLAQVQRNEI